MTAQAAASTVSTAELIADGILEINDGYRAKNSELSKSGLPFARAQNINGGFSFAGADRFPADALQRVGRKRSLPGDCVFTSKGSVGRVAFVTARTEPFVYSPQLTFWRSLSPEVLDPVYLRYWLQGPEFVRQRDAVKGSTDMADYVNLRDQRRMLITLPVASTQRKIAAILSAYDDLIENRNRRIKILEEMAQRIYREWFIDFGYPGHENVPLVDSELGRIPQGWEVRSLGDVCNRITDGAHMSPPSSLTGYPMASVKDMGSRKLLVERCRRISPESYRDLVRQDCRPRIGDVLIAKDGSYLKHVFTVERDEDIVILSSIAILRPGPRIRPSLLALYLRQPDVGQRLKAYVSGVAIPRIVLKDFRSFRVVVPPIEIQEQFEKVARPMLRIALVLDDTCDRLRASRDLLVPVLTSGDIDVENLDIAVEDAVA